MLRLNLLLLNLILLPASFLAGQSVIAPIQHGGMAEPTAARSFWNWIGPSLS
jgi:hypothetical protein